MKADNDSSNEEGQAAAGPPGDEDQVPRPLQDKAAVQQQHSPGPLQDTPPSYGRKEEAR